MRAVARGDVADALLEVADGLGLGLGLGLGQAPKSVS